MPAIGVMATYLTAMTIKNQDWKESVNRHLSVVQERLQNHITEKSISKLDLAEQELRLVERINAMYQKLDERNAAQDKVIADLPPKDWRDRYDRMQQTLERNSSMLNDVIIFIKTDDERDKRVDARLEKIESQLHLSPKTTKPTPN